MSDTTTANLKDPRTDAGEQTGPRTDAGNTSDPRMKAGAHAATRAEARPHTEVVDRLGQTLDAVLGPLISASGRHALLDFPDHANVGDSAIWAGEVAWLRRRTGRGPAFADAVDADGGWRQADLSAHAAILLHGGGNFGDIYPRHQTFRETLLSTHRRRPVVQLPQSIHYGNTDAIARTAVAIAGHGAFTLLVRDHESRALAAESFPCAVHLCPDMAFGLGPLARPCAPTRDVLLLLRGDTEATGIRWPALPPGWHVTDWMNEPDDVYRTALRAARMRALRSGNPFDLRREARRAAYFDALARQRIDRGLTLLSTARYVITDRLHAHILCTLMGIPHAFLDNSYGKIARYAAAFDTIWSDVTAATTPADAIGAAEAWLGRT